MSELLHTAILGLPPPRIGKVREVYDLGNELLIVATDRISAFDVVMANGIPDKGAILNQTSNWWFDKLAFLGPNHLISSDSEQIQRAVGGGHPELNGRSVLAKKAQPLPVECVVRGYIAGSLFKEYRANGATRLGLDLPEGLLNGSRLAEPIFTPATKATEGHDENISFQAIENQLGTDMASALKNWSLSIYNHASEVLLKAGIILADTKFEFGIVDGELTLIDEVLTPDSSRFWPADQWRPGEEQPSFDKQFLREYLEQSGWDKTPPGPVIPPNVVEGIRSRYIEAYERVSGDTFPAK